MEGSKDQGLAGVEFLVTDSSGAFVGPNNGIYKTDKYGRITISDLKTPASPWSLLPSTSFWITKVWVGVL